MVVVGCGGSWERRGSAASDGDGVMLVAEGMIDSVWSGGDRRAGEGERLWWMLRRGWR